MGLFNRKKKEETTTATTTAKTATTTSAATTVKTATTATATKVETPKFPKVGTVTATSLNIREGAKLERPVITSVQNGVRLTLLDELNGWYKVQLSDGQVGWASGEFIQVS